MGVDWIPCRVEPGCTREEIDELVRREALQFRASGYSCAQEIDPRICFSEAQKSDIERKYRVLGPLHRKLLFKIDSHRISVVTQEPLFPIEWRVNAERTIPPWDLAPQLAAWRDYRDEVARGLHRAYLGQLYVYVQIDNLVSVDWANLRCCAQEAIAATGGWATRPDVVACRDRILSDNLVTLPPPPHWPDGRANADFALVAQSFERLHETISAWNTAVQRGNKQARLPARPPSFDEWIAQRLGDKWFPSFLDWAEPWKQGGYGLYRDCE